MREKPLSDNIDWATIDVLVEKIFPIGVYLKADTSGLPAGYTRLKYIGSSGTQYIDTGIKSSNLVAIYAIGALESTSGNFLGEGESGRYVNIGIQVVNYKITGRVRSGSDTNLTFSTNIDPGTDFHTFSISSADIFTVDGVKIFGASTTYAYTGNNIYLFALNTKGTAINFSTSKIQNCKVFDNGVLVGNFVAVRRNSDNVLGMYDLVSGGFFTNAGTGTFEAGPAF